MPEASRGPAWNLTHSNSQPGANTALAPKSCYRWEKHKANPRNGLGPKILKAKGHFFRDNVNCPFFFQQIHWSQFHIHVRHHPPPHSPILYTPPACPQHAHTPLDPGGWASGISTAQSFLCVSLFFKKFYIFIHKLSKCSK